MQQLLIDAGNTRMKTAMLDAGHIQPTQAIAYGSETPLSVFKQALNRYSSIDRIIMVHVLGGIFAHSIEALCHDLSVPLQLIASEQSAYGVTIAYASPKRYGADRFVGLVAAHALYPQETCIVIDCGTAITLDVVDAEGKHHGGLIYPGIQLCGQSLSQGAKGVSGEAYTVSEHNLLADNTQTAVANACFYGAIAVIEAFCQRIQMQFQAPVKCLLCGGDAKRFISYLPETFVLRENLLFEGLKVIAEVFTPHHD
jgi:type III pantothenate kinase